MDSPAAVRVEAALPADTGELLTVQRAAYVGEAQLYGDPFIPPLVESAEQIRKAFDGDVVVLKAVEHGRIVGTVRARFNERTCLVGRLAVAPDRQRAGIASRLMSALEEAVAERADSCLLSAGHLSEGALRLFRRCGYRELRRERVAAHRTLVHMTKPLTPASLSPLPSPSHPSS